MERDVFKLGAICSKIGSGATPSGGKEAYRGGGYKLVRSQNVVDLYFSCDGLAEINEEQATKLNNVKVEENDVLLNITGDSVARSCLAPKAILPARVNQHVSIIRPKTNILNPHYLLYWLIINKQYLLALASTGATRNALTRAMIKGLTLELPSLDIQCRIASVLSIYSTLIENNTKRISLLEKMAENLYKEWFVRFRFPGYEKVEMESGLPKGWRYFRIEDLCDVNKRTINVTKAPKEILYLDTGSITCGRISELESIPFVDAPSRARRLVKHNSIVYSTVRPNLQHYGILKDPPSNMVVSTGFAVLDCKYDIANIVYLALAHPSVYKYCSLIADCAVATYPSIKPKEIGRISIALPPMEVAVKWNDKLECLYRNVQNLQHQNTLLARQRDLLLPRLMSGKLEVKP